MPRPQLNKIERICQRCSKPFLALPSEVRRGGARFCSRPCWDNRRIPLAERFWRRVHKTEECWLWTGKPGKKGYGQIGRGGKYGGMVRVHRLSWELHYGPIPDGMEVCHSCDVRPCVNPAHLFLGTQQDNMADMWAKGRGPSGHSDTTLRGEAIRNAKLTEAGVREIRRLRSEGASMPALAAEFGVDWTSIRSVVRRETWRHVD